MEFGSLSIGDLLIIYIFSSHSLPGNLAT